MRSRIALALLLGGCSQVFGLEPPATAVDGSAPADTRDVDAPQGCDAHDFDGDGISDSCDMCPHVAGTNADSDGDGVGDACDPRPSMSGDQRLLWLGFYDPAAITGWVDPGGTGAWSVSGGMLMELATNSSRLNSPTSYATDIYFATSLQITQPVTNEVGFCAANMPPQYYCCVANDGSMPVVGASTGQVAYFDPFPGSLDPGKRVDITGTLTGSQFECRFFEAGATTEVLAPGGGNAGPVAFYATTPIAYRYLFVVAIGS